ncbi:MAG: hypothetical protein C4570_06485 [Ammonifex sp.]|nr:MAG: hypothetical protein C4570_06485 [Ammonifex sp.]
MIGLMLVHLGMPVVRWKLEQGKRYRVHVHAATCEVLFDAVFEGWNGGHGEPFSEYAVAKWDNGVKLCGPAWNAHEVPPDHNHEGGEGGAG